MRDGFQVVPPRGHVVELQNYKDKHLDLHFQINTFGFGYALDSELLVNLAKEGHGTNAFIPDAVIGRLFVSVMTVAESEAYPSLLSLFTRMFA